VSRARITTAVITAVAVATLCWVVIWQGSADEIAQAETRLDEVSQREALVRARVNAANQFTEGGAATRAELDALIAALPDEIDLAGFVSSHDAMATDARVRVESLTPDEVDADPPPSPPGTTAAAMEILVNGSSVAVRAYQEGLQQMDRLVAVDELEQTNDGTDQVSLRVRIRIFAVAT
jgi:Tfp pilus assembly protein PilO